ncbi:MAG: hypothetical protein ACR2NO_11065 [Chloroflexota bacterium]
MEFRRLTDDGLIARIESLDDGRDREALDAALDELFRRLRYEAAPEDLDYVRAVIDHLASMYRQSDDDEDGSDSIGVREPRRPAPQAGNASVAIEPRRSSDSG